MRHVFIQPPKAGVQHQIINKPYWMLLLRVEQSRESVDTAEHGRVRVDRGSDHRSKVGDDLNFEVTLSSLD